MGRDPILGFLPAPVNGIRLIIHDRVPHRWDLASTAATRIRLLLSTRNPGV